MYAKVQRIRVISKFNLYFKHFFFDNKKKGCIFAAKITIV